MHVDSAIRYGPSGLITMDCAMWTSDARFQKGFNGFRIVSIGDAVELISTNAIHVRRG